MLANSVRLPKLEIEQDHLTGDTSSRYQSSLASADSKTQVRLSIAVAIRLLATLSQDIIC